jgi:hypothetical protein
MQAYIHKLQSKSESTRKQILVVSLVLSMTLVSAVWIYGLGDRFSTNNTNVASNTAVDSNEAGPFTLFSDSIKSAYHNIAASVGGISFSGKGTTTTNSNNSGKQIELKVVEHK